jgi:hypothetical protein
MATQRIFYAVGAKCLNKILMNLKLVVTLRVVGGDGKGSLESETVKYGHESHGTRTRK